MRISGDPKDPGYSPFGSYFLIKLDGRLLEHCVTADEERGEAVVEVQESGRPKFDRTKEEIVREVRSGKVEIVFPIGGGRTAWRA